MKTISKLAALPVAALALAQTSIAQAEDLLGNTTDAAFQNISDTQTGMAPLILGVVGFTVVLGLGIKWLRKAG
ncbi:hypothetical protein [Sphingobium sp.]|uniref:hypothetical protein n=1 Tax=Sphingobium sp. TaxID=1912891 RepID=UPI0028BDCEEE|nr:hypothetical protein [Sphingobium sp.]